MHTFINHRFRWFCHGNDTRTCRSISMGPSRKRSGPVFGHRVRETVPYPWYGTMKDENSRGLNCPDRQTESTENDPTCPECDTSILGVVTRGPGEHFLAPCGCRVPTASVRALAGVDRGRGVATDGGTSSDDTEHSVDGFCRACQAEFRSGASDGCPECGSDCWVAMESDGETAGRNAKSTNGTERLPDQCQVCNNEMRETLTPGEKTARCTNCGVRWSQ